MIGIRPTGILDQRRALVRQRIAERLRKVVRAGSGAALCSPNTSPSAASRILSSEAIVRPAELILPGSGGRCHTRAPSVDTTAINGDLVLHRRG